MGAPRENRGGHPRPPSHTDTQIARRNRARGAYAPERHESRAKRGLLTTVNEWAPLLTLVVSLLLLAVAVATLVWMVCFSAPTVVTVEPGPPAQRSHQLHTSARIKPTVRSAYHQSRQTARDHKRNHIGTTATVSDPKTLGFPGTSVMGDTGLENEPVGHTRWHSLR